MSRVIGSPAASRGMLRIIFASCIFLESWPVIVFVLGFNVKETSLDMILRGFSHEDFFFRLLVDRSLPMCFTIGDRAVVAGSENESVVMAVKHAGSLWYSQPHGIFKQLNKMSCSVSELCGPLRPRGPGPPIKACWQLHFPISSGFGWRLCDVNPRE